MVAECRRQHTGADHDARRSGTQRAQPRQGERRMAIDVLPWLKVVADEDRIETDFLGKTREIQQLARRELLRRCLVSELDQYTSPRRRIQVGRCRLGYRYLPNSGEPEFGRC